MIIAYLKNIKISKLTFLCISIALTIVTVIYCYYFDGYDEWKTYLISTSEFDAFGVPLEFYFHLQTTAQTIWFSFITFIAITNIFATDRIVHKKSGFSNMMKTRTGHKRFVRSELILNTLFTFIYIMILQVVLIITVQILVGPFNFSSMMQIDYVNYTNIFVSSPFVNLIIYIIFSMIGYTLYSNFLFTLGSFIKNIYIYRGLGIILSIILTALPAMIFMSLYRMFDSSIFMDIGSLFFLPNLLNPGIQLLDSSYMILNSPYLNFMFQCIFVIIITMSIFHLGNKKEYLYD